MSELIIDNEIAERLRHIAQVENRSIDDVLRSALDSYPASSAPSDWPLVMARMAEADTDLVWNEYDVRFCCLPGRSSLAVCG